MSTDSRSIARAAVLDQLATRGNTLAGLCDALMDCPGYWDEWPTVESVLKQLEAEGVVARRGNRSPYWVVVA